MSKLATFALLRLKVKVATLSCREKVVVLLASLDTALLQKA